MRILNVINSVDPAHGGPIEGIKQMANALSNLGHSIEVISMDDPAASYVSGFPIPLHAVGPSYSRYSFSRRLVPWLREHAKGYDTVVINGLWGYASFGTWRGLRESSARYVVIPHGMLDPWFKREYPLKHLKKLLYWPWGDYRVLRDAQAVMFTCEEERLLARQSFSLYSANERVVVFGTARPAGDPEIQKNVFFNQFPETNGKRLLLSLGRIHPKKGSDLVIRAFASVLKADADWHLVIAGPDQVGWRRGLQDLAAELGVADRITWTGMLPDEAKWGAIRLAEVMFLPSHQENFGLVVAEALACGVPVLLSNKVNIWREVVADSAGFVADDNAEGAELLLRQWVGLSDAERAAMRKRSETCFETRFEINRAASSFIEMLETVVLAPRRMDVHN